MFRKAKNIRTQIADLPEIRPLSTKELDQIRGGNWQATLLNAMGWKSTEQTYMNTDGSTYTKTVWIPPKSPA
jgi:hypothetical protein